MEKSTEQYKKLEKVVVNTGMGRLSGQPNFSDKILPAMRQEFATITGQKPMDRPAVKSVSGFKLREGVIIGLKSTLRGSRKTQFLEKVIKIVFPRVRDFRGISTKNVDANGNLNFGIRDHLVFPEMTPETSKVNFGIEVTVVPKMIKNRDEAVELYRQIGVPFQKIEQKVIKQKHG